MLQTIIILFVSSLAAINSEAQKTKTFSKQYGHPFDHTYHDKLMVSEPATIHNSALQVTPDSASEAFNLHNNSGRILLKRPFKLWEEAYDDSNNSNASNRMVASFNTSFLINLDRINDDTPGEGLAFLIAPNLDPPPTNSYGKFLGLTNSSIDGNSTNKFVAVEVDTLKQDFDPDDNHLGINTNSVRSKTNVSLSQFGIQLSPNESKFYNLWVDYNGVQKVMEVYIIEATQEGPTPSKPSSPVLESGLDLGTVVDKFSYFGFSASTGDNRQLNCVLRWNLTVQYFHEEKFPWQILVAVGVPLLVVLVAGMVGMGYFLHRNRRKRSRSNILWAVKNLPGMPREFRFRELKKATNNFNEKNKLGQGGFGVVYRGTLARENQEIAIKWFSRENIKGEDDFLAELTIINRLRHKHLVRLLGWCHKKGKLLLVYDYMPNGSLDNHLFIGQDKEPLSWDVRHKIISGVAFALHYIHNEYDQRVVHRDLKASNIMLDADFSARLGDFGLARVLDNEKTSYAEAEGVLGTVGYIAPECFHTGKATQQSDIYAFGAVLMEIVCGQRPGTKIAGYQVLVDWVWSLYREGNLPSAVDYRLGEDYVVEDAERLLVLGLACQHPISGERPKAQEILQIISGTQPVPAVPPFKPAFIWPAMVSLEIDSSLGSWNSSQCISRESYAGFIEIALE